MGKKKRINMMAMWKEFNPAASKSIKEDFANCEYANLAKIADYLDNGQVTLVSAEYGSDIITNQKITNTYCIVTDGEYSWSNTLSYYVRKYNLRLPKEFEDKILLKILEDDYTNA